MQNNVKIFHPETLNLKPNSLCCNMAILVKIVIFIPKNNLLKNKHKVKK